MPIKNKCQRCNAKVCIILGECVYGHELIHHDKAAIQRIKSASFQVNKVLKLFNERTNRRMIFVNGFNKHQIIYPNKPKVSDVPSPVKPKEYKMIQLDPLTLQLYRKRIKQEAENDATN